MLNNFLRIKTFIHLSDKFWTLFKPPENIQKYSKPLLLLHFYIFLQNFLPRYAL